MFWPRFDARHTENPFDRHHHVEQGHVYRLRADFRETPARVPCCDHAVSVHPQNSTSGSRIRFIVVCYKNVRVFPLAGQ